MVRPTAANLTVPLSRAKDTTALASALHVLGTKARLDTLQLLMDRPMRTRQVPARVDELRMLEEIGLVTCDSTDRQLLWSIVPGALERIADSLRR